MGGRLFKGQILHPIQGKLALGARNRRKPLLRRNEGQRGVHRLHLHKITGLHFVLDKHVSEQRTCATAGMMTWKANHRAIVKLGYRNLVWSASRPLFRHRNPVRLGEQPRYDEAILVYGLSDKRQVNMAR